VLSELRLLLLLVQNRLLRANGRFGASELLDYGGSVCGRQSELSASQ